MKRIGSLFLAVAALFLISLFGCKKSQDQIVEDKNRPDNKSTMMMSIVPITTNVASSFDEFKIQIDAIGVAHNNFLEQEFVYFKHLKDSGNFPVDNNVFDSIALVEASTYFSENYYINTTPFYHLNRQNNGVISDVLQNVIDDIYKEDDNYSNGIISLTEYNDRLENLKVESYNIKNDLDRYSAGVAVAIAQYSFNYWTENFEKWNSTFNNSNFIPRMSDRQTRVAKEDIKGAVKGAVEGGVAGAATGGIGAVPGAIIGGGVHACVASLKQGFIEAGAGWLDWIPWI